MLFCNIFFLNINYGESRLKDPHGMTNQPGLSNAKILWNHVHCRFIYTYFAVGS